MTTQTTIQANLNSKGTRLKGGHPYKFDDKAVKAIQQLQAEAIRSQTTQRYSYFEFDVILSKNGTIRVRYN